MTDERIDDDRGDLDLTKQIEVLKARIADLESIEETHRKLNQELRKEIWQWKEKAGEVEALESRVKQQQELKLLQQHLMPCEHFSYLTSFQDFFEP